MTERRSLGPAIAALPLLSGALVRQRLLLVSRNTRPTRVLAYELGDRSIAFDAAIDDGDGAWGTTADDEWLYLGLLGARGRTNLYRVAVEDGRVERLAAIDAATIWDLALLDSGEVVGVTDERLTFAWDQRSGRARALGLLDDGESARAVTALGQRVVIGGTRSGRAWLRVHALDDRRGRDVLPEALARHQTVYALSTAGGRIVVGTRGPGGAQPAVATLNADLAVEHVAVVEGEEVVDAVGAGDRWAVATVRRSGRVVRLDHDDGGLTRLPAPVPAVENRMVAAFGGAIVGAAGDGSVWSMRDDGGLVDPVHLVGSGRVEGSPERVQSVAADAHRVLVGGSFGVAEHPTDGGGARWRPVPGEPKSIVLVDGVAYLAVYPVGAVYRLARDADAVERLAGLPAEQNRPQAVTHLDGTDLLAVTTAADRRGGGALHLVERSSGEVSSHLDVFDRAQHPTGLAAAGDLLLVGGSGAHPSLLCWDTAADRQRWRVDGVVEDAGALVGMAVVGDRLVAVGTRGKAAAIDLDDGQVTAARSIGARGGRMVALGDRAYLADGDRVISLDPAALDVEVVADGLDGAFWGHPDLASDGEFLYAVAGRDLVRLPRP